jgi:signal transduction histidine kinase
LISPPTPTRPAPAGRVLRVNVRPVRPQLPVTGVRLSLWRAVSLFRVATLAVCLFLIVRWQPLYERPGVALATGAAMLALTAAVGWLGIRGRAHRPAVVLTDVIMTVGLTLLTIPAQTATQRHGGMVTLTTIWAAGPTIEAAFLAGPLGGAVTAVVQFAASAGVAETGHGRTLYSGVLLLLTGIVVGYVARLAVRAEDELRVAAAAQAEVAERERLARSIHDGVLQVLGLVHRQGRAAGGQWTSIAAAAAEQEAALRSLITSPGRTETAAGELDLADGLRRLGSALVTVSVPGTPVVVDRSTGTEVQAAVQAALQNVAVHAGDGARAWVLLEALPDELRVTIRDDGTGMAPGRVEAAGAEGRIGLARSVRGRIVDLGGRCSVRSAPGDGTEIELVIPR